MDLPKSNKRIKDYKIKVESMSGVIVFGGSGFIGSHLINKLVARQIYRQ